MAGQLWLLRHGEAEPHDVRPDDERRLTDRGRGAVHRRGPRRSPRSGSSSTTFHEPEGPRARHRRLACEALGCEPVEHEALRAGFDVDDALELLAAAGEDERILVVGHDPDFSQVVLRPDRRARRPQEGRRGRRTPGRAQGELMALLRPRELERIALSPAYHGGVPELPEVEITARRLDAALRGATIESALAPGMIALKTFDPPLYALDGRADQRRAPPRQAPGRRRRRRPAAAHPSDVAPAGCSCSTSAPRCATARRGCCRAWPTDRELRLREFGTKQRAWVKLLRAGDVDGRRGARDARPRGVARPAAGPRRAARRAARGRCTRCCATSA